MGIYQHFRKEEHPFIDQVLSWKEDVERTYRYRLTDFLDPREQQIIESIIGTNNEELQLVSYGGGKYSERKRVIIAPFYEEITNDMRSEEHTSELQSRGHLVCRLLHEKKN